MLQKSVRVKGSVLFCFILPFGYFMSEGFVRFCFNLPVGFLCLWYPSLVHVFAQIYTQINKVKQKTISGSPRSGRSRHHDRVSSSSYRRRKLDKVLASCSGRSPSSQGCPHQVCGLPFYAGGRSGDGFGRDGLRHRLGRDFRRY